MRSAEGFCLSYDSQQGKLHFPYGIRLPLLCTVCHLKGDENVAIYHCSIKIISRGKGKSAVAASAYRSGEIIKNEYDGVIHDFTRKRGITYTEIMLPSHAPPEFADRSFLWNAVEKTERAKNSQLAREIEIALPRELDREQQIRLVREYVKNTFVNEGMCADIAIHDKQDGNPHAHIMLTMRPLEQTGEWGAKSRKEYILDKDGQRIRLKNGTFKTRKVDTTDWNNQEKAEIWRKAWADITNNYLARQESTARIDHRSYERQNVEQIPTIHLGVAVIQMKQRGIVTDKEKRNKSIRENNRILKELRRRIKALALWLKETEKKRQSKDMDIVSSVPASDPSILKRLDKAKKKVSERESQKKSTKILLPKTGTKEKEFLQEHDIETYVQLKERTQKLKIRYTDIYSKIKRTEKTLHEKRELLECSEKYLQNRNYYKAYMQTDPKKKDSYYARYQKELTAYKQAELYLQEHFGSDRTLKPKEWKKEIDTLIHEKDNLYREAGRLKAEVSEAETIKQSIGKAVGTKHGNDLTL